MEREAAHDRLRAMVAADEDPTLGIAETDQILIESAAPDAAGNSPQNVTGVAGSWASSTAVLPGAVIKVSDRFWRCIVGGTTATTAPSWPDLGGYPVNPSRQVDDGDVVWADNGTEWAGVWNLELAAMIGWERKAAKAAARYSFATDGQSFQRAQIGAMCLNMADRFRRRLSTSTKV